MSLAHFEGWGDVSSSQKMAFRFGHDTGVRGMVDQAERKTVGWESGSATAESRAAPKSAGVRQDRARRMYSLLLKD